MKLKKINKGLSVKLKRLRETTNQIKKIEKEYQPN